MLPPFSSHRSRRQFHTSYLNHTHPFTSELSPPRPNFHSQAPTLTTRLAQETIALDIDIACPIHIDKLERESSE